jgi:hypothetical protein
MENVQCRLQFDMGQTNRYQSISSDLRHQITNMT